MPAISPGEHGTRRRGRVAWTGGLVFETGSRPACTLLAHGPTSEIRFLLARVASGLYVEREEIRGAKAWTLLSMLFMSSEAFEQWHDADPLRFDDPHVHSRLKAEAGRLWQSSAADNQRGAD